MKATLSKKTAGLPKGTALTTDPSAEALGERPAKSRGNGPFRIDPKRFDAWVEKGWLVVDEPPPAEVAPEVAPEEPPAKKPAKKRSGKKASKPTESAS